MLLTYNTMEEPIQGISKREYFLPLCFENTSDSVIVNTYIFPTLGTLIQNMPEFKIFRMLPGRISQSVCISKYI